MNMRWPIIISLGCLTACAGAIPENREAAFIYAVDQLKNGRAAQSASAAWRYAKGATVEDPRYDRALRLLARSAERMGLSYAAAQWYRDIAQGRRDPELMSEAIRGLKIIIESGAFDEDALVEGFIATTSIEGLPESLQAFVYYYQGLNDVRGRKERWARDNFAKIPSNSSYAARAAYVRAVQDIAKRDLNESRQARSLREETKSTCRPGKYCQAEPGPLGGTARRLLQGT